MHVRMKCVVLVVLLSVFCIRVTDEKSQITIYTVLHALDKTIQYYRAEYMNMNLDGAYGLRVIEGQSTLLLEEYEAGLHQHLDEDVVEELQKFKTEAKTIANMALPHVRDHNPEYFKHLMPLIREPWKVSRPHRKTDITSVVQGNAKQAPDSQFDVVMDEETSDECMAQLMGTNNKNAPCTITAECWFMMTKRKQNRYALTHQVLYFALGEQLGCTNALNDVAEEYGKGSIRQIQHELCSAMLQEAKKIVLIGIPTHEEDLLMEQVFICGSLGYVDFIRLDWLDRILSWQHSNGCYGYKQLKKLKPSTRFRSERDLENHHIQGRLPGDELIVKDKLSRMQEHRKVIQNRKLRQSQYVNNEMYKSRKLKRVQDLKDGCEAHKTAVASGALIVHIRFFIDPGPPGAQAMLFPKDEQSQPQIHLDDYKYQIPRKEDQLQLSLQAVLVAMVIMAVLLFLMRQFFKQRKITLRLWNF
ncbi:UPF0764 protein C16orf89 homolog isoform X2 [Ptychodera flava]|uniref:UPF0764 protein C16orf89 homolog isoform X2 n=1 Tax=Ptychodera flava TaxID=63121 RepID=UPI00396A183D